MGEIYTVSKKEINRRIAAFTTLIIFFFLFSIVFSLNYIIEYLNIAIYIILIVGVFLFISRIVVGKYFNSLLKTNVELSANYIRKSTAKYLIKDIRKIIVKKTTSGHIREIKIKLINNKSTYINNSIDNIEDFATKLRKLLPKDTIDKTIREPINYDHPTFYFFLGVFLSFASIKSVKLAFTLTAEYLKLTSYCISFLSIIMGIYFIAYKPIYKRDEKKGQIADYIWGCLFITGAMVVLLRTF